MKSLRPILWLYVLPAILLALLPATHDALLYDRVAILHGQLWRLWTGHWIHFSWSHLAWDLFAVVLAGTWLEKCRPGQLLRYTLLAAPLISGSLLITSPTMITYGGLSGLATGVVTLVALTQIKDQPTERLQGWDLLGLTLGKIIFDTVHQHALFAQFDSMTIQPSVAAHCLGVIIAGVFFAFSSLLTTTAIGASSNPA